MWGPENIWLIALCGLAAFIANVMYMMGGTQGFGLWWRRFLATFILMVAANGAALFMHVWHWQYLLFFPALIAGMSLGYGAKTTGGKIVKRLIFALGVTACCALGAWAHGFGAMSLVICGLSVFTGLTSIVLGVINPFNNAPLEQFLICQVLTLYVPFWAFVR